MGLRAQMEASSHARDQRMLPWLLASLAGAKGGGVAHLEPTNKHPDAPEDVAVEDAGKHIVLILNLAGIEHVEHLQGTQRAAGQRPPLANPRLARGLLPCTPARCSSPANCRHIKAKATAMAPAQYTAQHTAQHTRTALPACPACPPHLQPDEGVEDQAVGALHLVLLLSFVVIVSSVVRIFHCSSRRQEPSLRQRLHRNRLKRVASIPQLRCGASLRLQKLAAFCNSCEVPHRAFNSFHSRQGPTSQPNPRLCGNPMPCPASTLPLKPSP